MWRQKRSLHGKNFQIIAIMPVVGENGHQWVNVWDEAVLEMADGKSQKYQWVDSFRFLDEKIVFFNGFGRAAKN